MHTRIRGLTLIELLITVVILALLLTVVMPNVRDTISRNRITATGNDILTAIHLARNEAVARGVNVSICPTGISDFTCTSGGWNEGWLVWADLNGDLDVDAGEERIRSTTEAHHAETAIAASGNLDNGLVFGPDGTARNLGGGTETLAITKDKYPQGLRISVSATGNVSSEHFER